MSLQIWLPFTGHLDNQGLDTNVTLWNNSGATVNNNGKLGKCYSFDATDDWVRYNINKHDYDNKPISYACWFKSDGSKASGTLMDMGADLCLSYTYSSGVVNFNTWRVYGTSSRAGDTKATTTGYDATQWHHVVGIFDATVNKIYVDGVLAQEWASKSQRYWVSMLADSYNKFAVGKSSGSTYWVGGLVNDVRVYDHILSPKEVAEIAKGLVLHYKLDENLNVMNNCYSYPTFNTSATSGGWYHWGGSGHIGTYGQNTDKNYIFNKSNTYSHWIADGAEATKPYLVYQSPAFEGGYRSIQCIAKEENGLPITDDILYPSWNARDGGTANDKWTSVTALGNGFYLCKCEGVHQNGSNDLIGFNVKPGYKVYISEAYCENDKEMCSDIFNKNALWETIYDCSGYCNNGELYAVGKNLINKSTITSGCYFNSSGALVATSGWNCTDYISLKPGTAYIASSISTGGSGTYYVLYDINKKITRTVLITANVNPSFTTSDTERYVRFSIRSLSNELDTAKLEEGTTATDYETGTFLSEKGSPRYSLAINPHSLNSTSNAKAGTAYIRGDCTLTTPNALTIAFWAYPRAQGYGSNTGQGVFCFSNSTGDNVGSDYLASAINHYDSKVSFNSADGSLHIIPAITFTANEWHHYAFTYDGQNANAYKDGVLTGTKAFTSAIALGSFKYVVLGLSKAGGVWRRNNNTYSDLRVYATCLNIDDIKRLYNAPISLANNGTLFAGEFVET